MGRLSAWRVEVVAALFVAGLCLRTPIFVAPHLEGDELIYATLVEQLASGGGYTLQGSPLLEGGGLERAGYDRSLFFHPPGGIALFWLFKAVFGPWGFALVQLGCYALFFWSMVALGRSLRATASDLGVTLVAALSAVNPLMTHVGLKYWLDGPLLAFATLAVALFVRALDRRRPGMILAAGAVLGYASLIKPTAFLVAPGALLLARSLSGPLPRRDAVRSALLFLLPAAAVQLPWEAWQWAVAGSPFPVWAGRPAARLVAENEFIHFVTVVRSPWVYLTLTPQVVWSLGGALLMLPFAWADRGARRLALSCLAWVLTVLGFHVAVGYLGYSRLLRYAILITPATVLMFAALVDAVARMARCPDAPRALRAAAPPVLAVALLSLALEAATAVRAARDYDLAHLVTLFGRF